MSLHGQGVKEASAGEKGVVAGGKNASHDHCVDDAACSVCAGHLEDDGEGRGARVFTVEVWVGIRNVEADQEDRQDVEEEDAPENIADDFGDVSCRVFCLARRDGD